MNAARDGSVDALPLIQGRVQTAPATGHPNLLRIADWNIKSARDSSIDAIETSLRALDADVITLQELDRGAERTSKIDEPALLAQMLGYNYVFAETIPWQGGYYGIATLSRFSFSSVERLHLSNAQASEPRTAVDVRVCAGKACIHAINHHADVVAAAANLSMSEVLAQIRAELGSGVALLGDLNQVATDPGPEACVAAGLVDLGAVGAALTESDRRIDYAFVDARLSRCASSLRVAPTTESDHNLLSFDLDLDCLAHSD